ncbi:Rieske 2Fe-2S domain-containing protein [Mycobacterium sp. CBMA293]|uniref:QcrA and Rieske domain-containing protein n=2 Tax=Mycolicibacterium TaxID=1866885 RepID=UPI0012DCFF2A|nr:MULTISPECIES: Rieske (2Fe-2S) protein [unclassified Mycolicibacterium]MUL48990.1 Rieske 2Fe-2S domain-containing protein [Mycolicibacterium sp. CBMA 360]MUL58595.1 Rieske 2Fe-2S domain-containing protein [Mycolicibacterium sp. CBMA 335]MUL74053.1 Rieske 2Fe-2S domain-containing protein [Mycolicibacterium sp. CBMA 311]MUL93478.1 Rieske 2Fe-2S domain-containing protein [Mycolicibacterium sp. CBMA 230]MUM04697.1 Rieske (2Fe-2S) protein [Mycolicibacterium sp. CBMA 213]
MTGTGHDHRSAAASRRGVLIGAGAVGAGLVIAACGGKDTSPAGSQSASSETSAKAESTTVKTADVPVGGGVVLKDSKVVVTQPKPGEFKAFSAVCTHRQCTVSKVADGDIDCPCHGSQFSAVDGSVVKGPAEKPLEAKTVTVAGDTLTIS